MAPSLKSAQSISFRKNRCFFAMISKSPWLRSVKTRRNRFPVRISLQMRAALLILLFAGICAAAEISAAEIMKRVAENQDRAQNDRLAYLYDQHVKVGTRHTNGKLAREEIADYTVTPGAKTVERKQTAIQGRYLKKGRYNDFTGDPIPESGTLDGGLVSGFRESLFDKDSKDGLDKDLFPLTTEEQKELRFELAGEQMAAGRRAYRLRFGPKDSHEYTWAGEALIDEEEFQPVSVYTRLSRRLPLAVRTLLGTDVPGIGFNVSYRRLEKDIWFPVSFGTEFRLRAVFFINRVITVSLENKNFKHASAESQIRYVN
jgi:hypothetical protein